MRCVVNRGGVTREVDNWLALSIHEDLVVARMMVKLKARKNFVGVRDQGNDAVAGATIRFLEKLGMFALETPLGTEDKGLWTLKRFWQTRSD